jgi:hypothetical protein
VTNKNVVSLLNQTQIKALKDAIDTYNALDDTMRQSDRIDHRRYPHIHVGAAN